MDFGMKPKGVLHFYNRKDFHDKGYGIVWSQCKVSENGSEDESILYESYTIIKESQTLGTIYLMHAATNPSQLEFIKMRLEEGLLDVAIVRILDLQCQQTKILIFNK